MTEDDRKAFDEWWESRQHGIGMLVSRSDCLLAWLAALAHERKQAAELVDAVERWGKDLYALDVARRECSGSIEMKREDREAKSRNRMIRLAAKLKEQQ